ncbi:MAG: DUF885 domain-containing protein [Chloroflexota bacterium]
MSAIESTGSSAALARLADETWDGSMAAQPIFATSIGDARFDDRLPDNAPGAVAAERRRLTDLLDRARELPSGALTGQDAVTHEALIAYLEMELDLVLAGLDRWSVDPLEGPQVSFLNLASFQPIDDPAEGRRLIERWRAMDGYLDRSIADLMEALDGGLVSPEAPIRAVLDELDDVLAGQLANSPLMAPAAAARPAWSPAERAAFDAELESIVGERIRPAFGRYRRALMEAVLPRARSNERPGISEVPGGREAYGRLIRAHTSLDLAPEAIHATGLAEVERIDAELEDLAGRALGTTDRTGAIERLRTDAGLQFATGAEIMATAERALARASAAIPDWFATLPVARCEVVEMGAHESKHSTIAYYLQPAEDGRRPGRYYVNTSAPQTRPRYEAEALAFHEAVPGHHLQLAIAQELRGLPAFRRHAGTTAFIEGWGLYSERLGDEMGLYSGDLDRIGIASFDGWRACRLVVDTGIHALGWSRDRAIEFMLEHTALAPDNIVNEVDRYITWPGQALAYKLGQLEIRRLRDAVRSRLGAGFDIRAFHDALLAQGALPLSTLATTVEATLPSP